MSNSTGSIPADGMPLGPSPDPAGIGTASEFAAALAALRERRGRTVREVAKAADLPSSTLGGYLSGRHLPPITRLPAFAGLLIALGVPLDEHEPWIAALRRASQHRSGVRGQEPYPGLRAFDMADETVFFGRDDETAAAAALIRDMPQGILIVLGASGSGKSSLIRAGVLCALGPEWTHEVIRPGTDPQAALAALNVEPMVGPSTDSLSDVSAVKDVLVVDQFEELWTQTSDPEVRGSVVSTLVERASRPGHRVVLVVRSDFYAAVAAVPELVKPLRHRSFLVSAMSPAALTMTITGPAAAVDATVEAGLASEVLRDLAVGGGDLSAVLPHLSHAMHLAWEHRSSRVLTLADYDAVGRVSGAIARSAEDAYAALSAEQREVARSVLLRMVVVDEDAAPTAATLPLTAALSEDEMDVLDHFARHRLIALDDLAARFAHEAVLSAWDRLAGWIESDRTRLAFGQVVQRESRAWMRADHEPSLLLRGTRLEAASDWLNDPRTIADPDERQFVEASEAAHAEEASAAKRRLRRTRILLAAVSVTAVAALTAAGLVVQSREALATERDVAQARQLAAESVKLGATDPMVSRELAVAAYQEASTLQSRSVVLSATGDPAVTAISTSAGMPALAAEPRGTHLAVGSTGGVLTIYDVSGQAPVRGATVTVPGGGEEGLDALVWHAGPPLLAAVTSKGRGIVYDVSDISRPQSMGSFAVQTYVGGRLDIAPDGSEMLVPTETDGIRRFLLDPVNHSLAEGPAIPSDVPVTSLNYLADGRVVTGSPQGVLTLRGPGPAHAPLATSALGKDRIVGVLGLEDHVFAATRGQNHAYAVPLEQASLGTPVSVGEFDSWVNDVAVSADGTQVTFVSADGSARTMDRLGRVIDVADFPDGLGRVVYLPDGRLAVGVASGQVVLRGGRTPIADEPKTKVFATSWAHDGRTLVTFPNAQGDQVRVWDVGDSLRPVLSAVLPGMPVGEWASGGGDISPNGRRVVAGIMNGQLVGWARPETGGWQRAFTMTLGTANVGITKFIDDTHVFVVDDDTNALVIDVSVNPPSIARRLTGVHDYPNNGGVSAARGLLAVALDSGSVAVWGPASDAPLVIVPGDSPVWGVTFSTDGMQMLTASHSGHLRLYAMTDPTKPRLIEDLVGATGGIQDVDLGADGSIAAAVTDGNAVLFRQVGDHHELSARITTAARMFTVRFSPDATRLASGEMKATVQIWSTDPDRAARHICSGLGDAMTTERWSALLPGVPYRKVC